MTRLQRHLFVCVNERSEGHPKGCCSHKGGKQVRERFKEGLARRGLKGIVRANAAGCLDTCALGVTVVVYPEATWYRNVTVGDVEEIIEKHILDGRVVERLLMYPTDNIELPSLSRPAREEG